MRRIINIAILLCSVFLLNSCGNAEKRKTDLELNYSLDEMGVLGSVLVYDLKNDSYFHLNDNWDDVKFYPGETFNIPLTLLALEAGIASPSTQLNIGEKEQRFFNQQQKVLLNEALKYDCKSCMVDLAIKLGTDSIYTQLERLGYSENLNCEPEVKNYWSGGRSFINQHDQIDFLKKLYLRELAVSNNAQMTLNQMLLNKVTKDYKRYGLISLNNDSGIYLGWFVGYYEVGENVYFVATILQSKYPTVSGHLSRARIEITEKVLHYLGYIP